MRLATVYPVNRRSVRPAYVAAERIVTFSRALISSSRRRQVSGASAADTSDDYLIAAAREVRAGVVDASNLLPTLRPLLCAMNRRPMRVAGLPPSWSAISLSVILGERVLERAGFAFGNEADDSDPQEWLTMIGSHARRVAKVRADTRRLGVWVEMEYYRVTAELTDATAKNAPPADPEIDWCSENGTWLRLKKKEYKKLSEAAGIAIRVLWDSAVSLRRPEVLSTAILRIVNSRVNTNYASVPDIFKQQSCFKGKKRGFEELIVPGKGLGKQSSWKLRELPSI